MMKKLFTLIFFSAFVLTGCGDSEKKAGDEPSDSKTITETETKTSENKSAEEDPLAIKGEVIEIDVPTIQCGTCKKNIKKALDKVDGIYTVNISVENKKCLVDYDKNKTDLTKIEGAIVSAGYQANDKPADKEAYDKLDDCCKEGGH